MNNDTRPSIAKADTQQVRPMMLRSRWLPLILFVLALCGRWVFLHQSTSSPSFAAPIVAAGVHDLAARRLATSGEFDSRSLWLPPFYPVYLALVYKSTGGSIWVAKLLQALLGASTCWLVWIFGKRRLGTTYGLLAATLTAFYGPLLLFESELVPTVWAAFWSLVLLLCFDSAEQRPGPDLWLALGSASALAVLLEPLFAPFVVLAWGWLVWRARGATGGWRLSLAAATTGLAAFALLALPAMWLSEHGGNPVSRLPDDLGSILYRANKPAECPPASVAAKLQVEHLDQPFEPVGNWIAADPANFLRGLGSKALRLVSSRELPGDLDIYFSRQWSALLRATTWRVGWFGFPWGLLLPLAAVGLVRRRAELGTPLLLFLTL